MLSLPLLDIPLRTRAMSAATGAQVWCAARRKWVALTPEEHVRQALLQYMLSVCRYPAALTAVERSVEAPGLAARFDLVVYDRNGAPWLIAECKEPGVPLTNATLQQLLRYQNQLSAPYWVLCNGLSTLCADAREPAGTRWMETLPTYDL